MSLGSAGACSRPEEVGEVEVAEVVEERLTARVRRAGEHLHLRVGLECARFDLAAALARRVGQRDHDAVDALPAAHVFEIVGRAEHAQRAHGSTDELRVVVDEADHDGVAERAAFELERERDAGVGCADDQRSQARALAVPLAFECEEARLEPDAAAAEKDEQRGDRRRGEQRQGVVLHVAVPGERERGREHADRSGRDDAHGFLDGRVSPDGAVEAHHLVDEELYDDRNQQVRNEPADAERERSGVSGEIREQPGGTDDPEVEDAQTCRASPLGDSVHGAREPVWIRSRVGSFAQRRCRKSTHPRTPPPHRSARL